MRKTCFCPKSAGVRRHPLSRSWSQIPCEVLLFLVFFSHIPSTTHGLLGCIGTTWSTSTCHLWYHCKQASQSDRPFTHYYRRFVGFGKSIITTRAWHTASTIMARFIVWPSVLMYTKPDCSGILMLSVSRYHEICCFTMCSMILKMRLTLLIGRQLSGFCLFFHFLRTWIWLDIASSQY